MRISIVTYQGYDGAGVLHAHKFANELIALGHEVLLLLCGSMDTASALSKAPNYLVREAHFEEGLLAPPLVELIETFAPEIIHLWTPRHLPARVGLEAWSSSNARLVIHYEDDEEYILSEVGSNCAFGRDDLALYQFLRGETFDAPELEHHADSLNLEFLRQTVADPYSWPWIHPLFTPVVEKLAAGFTSISPAYGRLLSDRSSQPIRTLYPGVDLKRFGGRHKDKELERELRIEGRTVFLYSGSIAAFHDFTAFLEGLPAVVKDYPEIVVVQLGHNYIPHLTEPLLEKLDLANHVVFAGPIPHADMPRYLGLADVFLGVTALNRFNAHRLPSKIPEYMAIGRPILLSDTGAANELEDGAEVIKIKGDSAGEIELAYRRAMDLRSAWSSMGRRLRDKARTIFDWRRNTERLVSYYEELLAVEERIQPEGFDLNIVAERPRVPGSSPQPDPRPALDRDGARVVIVTEGRIGHNMSGIGIRYAELSRSLGQEFDVTLAHPGPTEVGIPGVRQIRWKPADSERLMHCATEADVVIVHSYLLQKLPALQRIECLLVVDLYCPFIFENIEIHKDRGLPLEEREAIHDNDLRVLNDQLLRGDYFLAATDRQRDWILGALTALGRLRPSTCGPGAAPENFVGLVPFGLSGDTRGGNDDGAAVMRGVWPFIAPEDTILLWGGGIWSWLDPLTPVRAMEKIARSRSDIKLVFLSTRTAEDVVEMPILRELFDFVAETEDLDRVVIFNTQSFISYKQRGAYFSEADVGICAHHCSLESHFAFRTRVLDYLNFGLPILTTDDDFFGAFVNQRRLGRALPVGDVDAWAEAILELADAKARKRYRKRTLDTREEFLWSTVTKDLVSLIRDVESARLLSRRAPRKVDQESASAAQPDGYSGLSVDSLFDLAFESLANLVPKRTGKTAIASLGLEHEELLLHAQRLEEEIAYLKGHSSRLQHKVDLVKKIPLAAWLWRTLTGKKETVDSSHHTPS